MIRNSSIEVDRKLYIGNLHPSTTEGDLIKLFQKYGTVEEVRYIWHKNGPLKGRPKGFAFVSMSSIEEANVAASNIHHSMIRGKRVVIGRSETDVQMRTVGSNSSIGKRKFDTGSGSDSIQGNIKRLRDVLHQLDKS
jgi:RNA recognition motif-containing protein